MAWSLVAPAACFADRLLLRSGGAVEGTLLNRQQTPRTSYEILTRAGVRLVLPADEVVEVAPQKDAEASYDLEAPKYANTVEEQWKLAEWCRAHQLKPQRERHLRQILALAPDHVPARHALGYVQLQGEWTTRSEHLSERGYRLYKGAWRTPQDIALIEARENEKRVAREWLGRLQSWRGQLQDPRAAATAYRRLSEVRDPAAVAPLCELLKRERARELKQLYIEILSEIGDAQAIEALVFVSLNDPDVEVFHACAEVLVRLKPPNLQKPYLDALKNNNNVRINRAAYLLGQIGDASAIGPLIDVLLTSHQVVIKTGGRGGDAVSTSFDKAGGGSSFQSGASTQVLQSTVQNREVLDALTRLAGGQSFGYDLAAWRRWYAAERARGSDIRLK